MRKNTNTLIEASKEVGLDINREKTKCMVVYCHQHAGQNRNLITKKYFENVSVKIFENNNNDTELHSQRNNELIKFREMVAIIQLEYFIFPAPL